MFLDGAVLFYIIGDGIYVGQYLTAFFGILYLNAIYAMQHHDQLKRIDGIQPQSLSEQGLFVFDVLGLCIQEVQVFDYIFFDL